MTIPEAVRALTVGDCPTRREAVKTIREYFEDEEPLERIREEIEEYRDFLPWESNSIVKFDAINYILEQIIDKYWEPQTEQDVMFYPQVPGITPTVVKTQAESEEV